MTITAARLYRAIRHETDPKPSDASASRPEGGYTAIRLNGTFDLEKIAEYLNGRANEKD